MIRRLVLLLVGALVVAALTGGAGCDRSRRRTVDYT